jgi:hypothetical protein
MSTPTEHAPRKALRSAGRKRLILIAYGAIALTIGIPTFLGEGILQSATAEFYFRGNERKYVTGEEIPIELRVRTGGVATNAMQVLAQFNPDQLEIVKMTTDKSFCTFFTENSFSNDRGTVKVACGKPNPGFEGDSLAVGLVMRAKLPGDIQIKLDPEVSKILANDGRGSTINRRVPDPLVLSVAQF